MKPNYFISPALCVLVLLFASCRSAPQEEETPDNRPNILFAIADDASFPHMGAYGTDWVKTPAFDRVASEGILFTRAYTPNAKCAPSRSCILTGRNSWQLGAAANHWPFFPDEYKTYPEVLGQNGYHVGFTGKGWAPGKVGEVNGRPRQLTGKPYQDRRRDPPARHISNNDYAANFADFLDDRPAGQPFCFWYGATEPHRAYEFGVGIEKGGKSIDDIKEVPPYWPDTDTVRTDLLDYAFEIEHFDRHLQEMLLLLEVEGMLDNTIVIVTADNGMPFPRAKGQAYEVSNHLPLAIRWPKGIIQPGRTADGYVSFIDFAPTFLEIADVLPSDSGMQPITGRSLMDVLSNEHEGAVMPIRDQVLIGKERHDVGRPDDVGYPIRGIIKDNFLYIVNFETERWPAGNPETGYLNTDGSPTKSQILNMRRAGENERFWEPAFGKRPAEELYRLDLDPDCMNNLAENPEYENQRTSLREQLFEDLRAQGDPRIVADGAVFDEYPYANAADTSFYSRYMAGDSINAGWVNPSDFEAEPLE